MLVIPALITGLAALVSSMTRSVAVTAGAASVAALLLVTLTALGAASFGLYFMPVVVAAVVAAAVALAVWVRTRRGLDRDSARTDQTRERVRT